MDKENELIDKLAMLVAEAGGVAYFVGGRVRDQLFFVENKDIDIEVHGIEPNRLYEILEGVGSPITIGKSFGVYSLRGTNIDIAMPRVERAIGSGHRDFEVFIDPTIGTYRAAKRRDYTINSLMQNILTGELVDHFGGREDIRNRVLRHVDDESFAEDPLRVLRGAQFASRFELEIAPETLELCKEIDLSALSRERVEGELRKALLKGTRPSIFFESLKEMNQLDYWFPELEKLIGLEQDPIFHPEGDVWVHTMEVIDRAAKMRSVVSNPYAFMLLSLTHDLGKIVTTEFIKGRWHAYGHETKGIPLIDAFLHRIIGDKAIIRYVKNMVPLHMRPNMLAYNKSAVKVTNRLFDEATSPIDLIYFAMADKPVVSGDDPYEGDTEFLKERLAIYERTMTKPYVTGLDLINSGLAPGEYFNDALRYSHKLRLAGVDKDAALKQTLSYVRKNMFKDERRDKGKK